jgi:hypothetical protein
MREADYAALTMDFEEFCRCRKQVIKDFHEEYNVNRLEIYENDPDPGAAKYAALTDDIEKAEKDRKLLLVAKVDEIKVSPCLRRDEGLAFDITQIEAAAKIHHCHNDLSPKKHKSCCRPNNWIFRSSDHQIVLACRIAGVFLRHAKLSCCVVQ